jgi:hypothetical protein
MKVKAVVARNVMLLLVQAILSIQFDQQCNCLTPSLLQHVLAPTGLSGQADDALVRYKKNVTEF